ncbi:hypothetical protein [Phyllobacterium lublinensis]|uniref:hypothetical protein n=1 Tax=Phyllobacterium lublinensis TaxID=2875708 RepID=UPI001CCB5C67|nr:hypothetical protein [Phyllobacterium sp. 2063]MBZ9654656.1 hypothetical protein [Phyllobacterium sp. 2063]
MTAIRARFKRIILVTILVMGTLPSFAQTLTEEQKFYREQFAGWGGIVFRCLPDNPEDYLQKRLCSDAAVKARFLAAAAKVPFRDVGSEDYFSVTMAAIKLNNALVLEATIRATQVGNPRGVLMRLDAGSFYSDAIEKSAKAGTPESVPRSGTLSLWDKSVIGASTMGGNDLQVGMSNAFATVLEEFFAIFVESRN